MADKIKVIGIFSGGLDSLLASKIMVNEGFDVTILHFYTGFTDKLYKERARLTGKAWQPSESLVKVAEQTGAKFMAIDVSEEYVDIITNPRWGYGSAVNPCIDCHIFFLRKAREMMEREGAVLVFSGEVLGQRPMSQQRTTLRQIEKNAGLTGRLLRPLSAKLLDPTIPETEGIVNTENLYDISGRGRKRQMELAKEFGITFYPDPGGGCVLTDINFARRFKDLLSHLDGRKPTMNEINSLKAGRHLRLKSGAKILAGRNGEENDYLLGFLREDCWVFDTLDCSGTTLFMFGDPDTVDMELAASITARYSKCSEMEIVKVSASKGDKTREFLVKPCAPEEIEQYIL